MNDADTCSDCEQPLAEHCSHCGDCWCVPCEDCGEECHDYCEC